MFQSNDGPQIRTFRQQHPKHQHLTQHYSQNKIKVCNSISKISNGNYLAHIEIVTGISFKLCPPSKYSPAEAFGVFKHANIEPTIVEIIKVNATKL